MNHTRIGILVVAILATLAPSVHAAGKKGSKPKKEPEAVREPDPPAPPPPTVTSATATAPASAPAATDAPPRPESEPTTPKPVSVAPLLGYATANLKLGVGVRAGYTFENRLYVGGTFVYHLGSSDETAGPTGQVGSSAHFFYTGAEVGYELPVGPVLVRPYGGVGVILATVSLTSGGQEQSDTSTSFAFWPGCTVTYAIPRTSFYVGGDTKLIIATKGGDPSFGIFATGGMRF